MKKKYLILTFILIFSFIFSLVLGARNISISDIFNIFNSHLETKELLILREIRLPRVIGALLVGAALGVSGAIMQGLTKNALADPGFLGTSAGANFFLVIIMVSSLKKSVLNITITCFLGALLGTILVFGINNINKKGSKLKLVLSGSAVTALFYGLSEGIATFFRISKEVSMWTSGGLLGTTINQIYIITPFIIIGLIISIFYSKELTVLSLSEEIAIGLGQKTLKVKTMLFVSIILLCGSAVALVGNMAFVGLIIPHLARKLGGNDYKNIIPISILTGGIFLLIADTTARVISAPYETPIIAVVSVIALPFFAYFIKKGGKITL